MKLEISVNFDFNKLDNKIDDLIDDYVAGYITDSAEATKDAIDKGLTPKLKNSTIEIRKRRGHPTAPPLKATGKLYRSIKQNKDSLEMVNYGVLHHNGYDTTPNRFMKESKKVPARKFITTTTKNKDVLDKKFTENLRKALRSNVKVASIG